MRFFNKILWIAVLLGMFPDSLWGAQSLSWPGLMAEAVSIFVEPWSAEGTVEETVEAEADTEEQWNPQCGWSGNEETRDTLSLTGDNFAGHGESDVSGETDIPLELDKTLRESEENPWNETIFSAEGDERKVQTLIYTGNQLADREYLLENIFCVDESTSLEGISLSMESMLGKDFSLEKKQEVQILIYHTHSQEAYADSEPGNSLETVQGVGKVLAELLRKEYGYSVVHHTGTFDLKDGSLDRSRAYTEARIWLESYLKEHPEIQVVIDLHRDSVGSEKHLLAKAEGTSMAQLMLFNGLSRTDHGEISYLYNENRENNLAFGLQLKLLGDTWYPGLFRRNYLKSYRYNQHLRPRSILLEVGAESNTLEEACAAMKPFAKTLHAILSGEKIVSQ